LGEIIECDPAVVKYAIDIDLKDIVDKDFEVRRRELKFECNWNAIDPTNVTKICTALQFLNATGITDVIDVSPELVGGWHSGHAGNSEASYASSILIWASIKIDIGLISLFPIYKEKISIGIGCVIRLKAQGEADEIVIPSVIDHYVAFNG
jgi:hypothetical protein